MTNFAKQMLVLSDEKKSMGDVLFSYKRILEHIKKEAASGETSTWYSLGGPVRSEYVTGIINMLKQDGFRISTLKPRINYQDFQIHIIWSPEEWS